MAPLKLALVGSLAASASALAPASTPLVSRKLALQEFGIAAAGVLGGATLRGDGVVANGVADGAIVNYGDIKLVLCGTPPPRRLLHQQVACGSLQDVLRAARARKGLRRMLRAERRRGACQLGVLGRVVELEDEHRARRVALWTTTPRGAAHSCRRRIRRPFILLT